MKLRELNISYSEFESDAELPIQEQNLLKSAREMTETAYAPYSNFYVGAAVLLENGSVVKGNNQENAAYPSGLCAERVAIFSASSQFPKEPIKTIAITARSSKFEVEKPIAPCGACRQVISEYESFQRKPIKLIIQGDKGAIIAIDGIEPLLPLLFREEALKRD